MNLSTKRFMASLSNTKVSMSNFEKDKFINYQRVQDNLKIVKDRYTHLFYVINMKKDWDIL